MSFSSRISFSIVGGLWRRRFRIIGPLVNTYSVTVTASSGNSNSNTTLTVIVQ